MGTKRNASDSTLELEEAKRQNLQTSPVTATLNSGDQVSKLVQENNGSNMAAMSEKTGATNDLPSKTHEHAGLTSDKIDDLQANIGQVSKRLEDLYLSHSAMVGSVNFHGDFLDSINTRLNDAANREKLHEKKIEDLAFELQETKATLRQVNKKSTETVMELKSKNLVINGIPEKPDENCKTSVTNFLKNIVPNFSEKKLENAYRLSKPAKKLVRGMLVKFKDIDSKQEIMTKKSALKDRKDLNKVYCNNDLPDEHRKASQKMRLTAKYATSLGYKDVKAKGSKLVFEGRSYNEKELTLLPSNLRIENVVTRNVGLGVGFYGEHSYLSNQYPSRILMNGQRFLCADQAFYYFKGIICQYENTSIEIKKMIDPTEMKSLGEKIPPCPEWETKKEKLMKSVLRHKFDQNKPLREKLVNTGKMSLLECSTDM